MAHAVIAVRTDLSADNIGTAERRNVSTAGTAFHAEVAESAEVAENDGIAFC